MAIRVSQVVKLERPSKSLRCTNAFRKVSCTASSASSRLRVMRKVVRKMRCADCSHKASKAARCPRFAAATNIASLIFDSPRRNFRDDSETGEGQEQPSIGVGVEY